MADIIQQSHVMKSGAILTLIFVHETVVPEGESFFYASSKATYYVIVAAPDEEADVDGQYEIIQESCISTESRTKAVIIFDYLKGLDDEPIEIPDRLIKLISN